MAALEAVRHDGVPNYFDDQRFSSVSGGEFMAKALALGDFEKALDDPYPGIFDHRSWTYWNLRYHHEPVPPLPKRRIPL